MRIAVAGRLRISVDIKGRAAVAPITRPKAQLETSCEYASAITQLATLGVTPFGGGAGRPEKRVTAKSKLPQKKCTGLALPMKRARNSFMTRLACTKASQNFCA